VTKVLWLGMTFPVSAPRVSISLVSPPCANSSTLGPAPRIPAWATGSIGITASVASSYRLDWSRLGMRWGGLPARGR
jgi:hypothetical protein